MTTLSTSLVELANLLDHAAQPIPAGLLPPTAVERAELDRLLAGRGRVVVAVGDDHVTTALADDVEAVLAERGIGVLPRAQRAVLALVLLRCWVLPAARGEPTADVRVMVRDLVRVPRVPDSDVRQALQDLRFRGLVSWYQAHGVGPGPALHRLGRRARHRLEAELFDLVAGDDPALAQLSTALHARVDRQAS